MAADLYSPQKSHELDPVAGGLKRHIEAAGLMQKDLAAAIGVNPMTLTRLFAGDSPRAHPAMALQPVLDKLVEVGRLTQGEAADYLRQYRERRNRLLGRGQEE